MCEPGGKQLARKLVAVDDATPPQISARRRSAAKPLDHQMEIKNKAKGAEKGSTQHIPTFLPTSQRVTVRVVRRGRTTPGHLLLYAI
jgi:hypothetical protein